MVDLTTLRLCGELTGEDDEDTALLTEMRERAHAYLSAFEWCRGIRECYVGDIAIGGVVAVFLFRIDAAHVAVDEWLWVVVGDLPPAYLVVDDAPNPAAALEAYVSEMRRWVEAVEAGEPVDELIPVETSDGGAALEPTRAHAQALRTRLQYLEEAILDEDGRREG